MLKRTKSQNKQQQQLFSDQQFQEYKPRQSRTKMAQLSDQQLQEWMPRQSKTKTKKSLR